MFQIHSLLHLSFGHVAALAPRLAVLCLMLLPSPASAQCTFQQKLSAAPLGEYDQFGYSVAISGDTAIVGAPWDDHSYGTNAGSATILVRTGATWSIQDWVRGSDGFAGNNEFGRSVAVSDDTVAIGVPYDDHDGLSNRGSVYVYVRSGTTWSQQQVLAAGDPASLDNFGYSVALSGNTLLVGTLKTGGSDPPLGAAYVFQRIGSSWSQQAKLMDSTPYAGDYFGWSVALSEDANTAVVGATFDDAAGSDTGSASVFLRSGSSWSLQAKLTAADPGAYDYFGFSVSISGDTVAVGSAYESNAGGALAGSVYVFLRSGSSWSQQAKLLAGDGADSDQLGWSTAVNGDTIVAGALGDDSGIMNNSGAAYVFQRSGATWTQQSKFTSSDPDDLAYFGYAVAINNATAVVGSPRDTHSGVFEPGAAFVYASCIPTPPPCPSDLNGDSVVNGLDLAMLLSAWGPVVTASEFADLNDDGIVNGLDLAILLGNWGGCLTCPTCPIPTG